MNATVICTGWIGRNKSPRVSPVVVVKQKSPGSRPIEGAAARAFCLREDFCLEIKIEIEIMIKGPSDDAGLLSVILPL